RLERIAHHHAAVPAHEVLEGVGALVVADAVHHGAWCRQAPHLPGLVALAVKPGPAGLIEPDDGLGEHAREQCARRRFEAASERVELIPERLRGDDETVASEDPLLPREGDVIEILVDGDLDGKVERVTPARNGALGTERGLDAASTLAGVLLLLHL